MAQLLIINVPDLNLSEIPGGINPETFWRKNLRRHSYYPPELANYKSTGDWNLKQTFAMARPNGRLIRNSPCTGANTHAHPEEQVITVLKGKIASQVDGGEEKILGPGEAVYIPAGVEHKNWAVGDEDVEFISCKDVVDGTV